MDNWRVRGYSVRQLQHDCICRNRKSLKEFVNKKIASVDKLVI